MIPKEAQRHLTQTNRGKYHGQGRANDETTKQNEARHGQPPPRAIMVGPTRWPWHFPLPGSHFFFAAFCFPTFDALCFYGFGFKGLFFSHGDHFPIIHHYHLPE